MKIIIDRVRTDRDIHMTADGDFVDLPRAPLSARIFRAAVLIAVIAAGLAIAALALWFALILIPVALLAGAVAWAAWRWRLWRGWGNGDGRGQFRP
jgi:hypothetical protein